MDYCNSASPTALPSGEALSPTSPQTRSTSRSRLSNGGARLQLKRAGLLGTVGLVAHLLTWSSDGVGVNLVLVPAAYLLVALGHTFGWQPSRRWATMTLSVRAQLAVWCGLAIATLWHLDPWTVTTFLASTAVLLTAIVAGPQLDPVALLGRTVLRVLAGPLVVVHFVYRTVLALDQRWRASTWAPGRILVPLIGVGIVAALYTLSNSVLSQLSVGVGEWIESLLFGGDWALHGFFIVAWAAGGAGLFYRMRYVEGVCSRPFWGLREDIFQLSPKPERTHAASDGFGASRIHSAREKTSDLATGTETDTSRWSTASVTLVCVNALAVVLNVTDGFTTWFGERATSGTELKFGVHLGTWSLVLAVLLASAALCYLLVNPASDQSRARTLGLAWLGQNVMMVFTVALRNYHYTDAFGMTYKRLGVYLFLVCTLVGLYLLTRTVLNGATVRGLVRRQAWAIYVVLAAAAVPNWPSAFTWFNVQPGRQEVDQVYLRGLLPHNLTTWYALAPADVTVRKGGSGTHYWVTHRTYPVTDWRDWDLGQQRRAALVESLQLEQAFK